VHSVGQDSGGAIPGFGSGRVRAERSQGYERAGILGLRTYDDDVEDHARAPQAAGLDSAFADVEKLEDSLRNKGTRQ